jgi:hypothetical protein
MIMSYPGSGSTLLDQEKLKHFELNCLRAFQPCETDCFDNLLQAIDAAEGSWLNGAQSEGGQVDEGVNPADEGAARWQMTTNARTYR